MNLQFVQIIHQLNLFKYIHCKVRLSLKEKKKNNLEKCHLKKKKKKHNE